MNLEDQYHAAAMLRITQEDARRIAELEAERDNAWEELREIRAAISANPEESTLDEVVKLRQQLAAAQDEIDEQARIVGMGGEREIALRQQVTLLRKQVLEECAAIAEDTAAGRDAEAIADAIRAMKYKSG